MAERRRKDEKVDYLADAEQRKFARFRSSAFLGVKIVLKPLPPFFGTPMDGQMVDLSAGGMALLLPEALPTKTKMQMELRFPKGEVVACTIIARRSKTSGGGFLTGIEFLDMPEAMATSIDKLGRHFVACEERLRQAETPVCRPDCSFLPICDKPQKETTGDPAPLSLEMALTLPA